MRRRYDSHNGSRLKQRTFAGRLYPLRTSISIFHISFLNPDDDSAQQGYEPKDDGGSLARSKLSLVD